MQLKITPTTDLTLNLGEKKIGKLDALCIDLSNSGGLFNIPKVKLAVSIRASSFEGNDKQLNGLLDVVKKFKFLDVTLIK